jgi:hypothetical protein
VLVLAALPDVLPVQRADAPLAPALERVCIHSLAAQKSAESDLSRALAAKQLASPRCGSSAATNRFLQNDWWCASHLYRSHSALPNLSVVDQKIFLQTIFPQ